MRKCGAAAALGCGRTDGRTTLAAEKRVGLVFPCQIFEAESDKQTSHSCFGKKVYWGITVSLLDAFCTACLMMTICFGTYVFLFLSRTLRVHGVEGAKLFPFHPLGSETEPISSTFCISFQKKPAVGRSALAAIRPCKAWYTSISFPEKRISSLESAAAEGCQFLWSSLYELDLDKTKEKNKLQ